MTRLLSQLTKRELLKLPGFEHFGSYKTSTLKQMLHQSLVNFGIDHRGACVNDYINAHTHAMTDDVELVFDDDDEDDQFVESLMNIDAGYTSSKTVERQRYEENVHDTDKYQREIIRMMTAVRHQESFEVDINDDTEVQFAFTQVLRRIRKIISSSYKPMIFGYTLDNRFKVFNLNNGDDLEALISAILGEVTVESFGSDDDPALIGLDYIPVRFVVRFVRSTKVNGKTAFVERCNGADEVLEVDDSFRDAPDGAFFPYVNLIESLDLTRYQIYHKIDPDNYHDNCFVYACIQSGVVNDDEIQKLRNLMQTRFVPNKKILDIAIHMHCHFVVYRVDEKLDVNSQVQISIDTHKNPKVAADRVVKLRLFKDHFMIYDEKLPITAYYIEHRDELDTKHADVPPEKRFRIRGVNQTGYPKYNNADWTGANFMSVLRAMFDHNCFREIRHCEHEILATCEFDNHLNDYVELNYDEALCCKAEVSELKQITNWSHIYYADYETDVTVSPHRPSSIY